MTSAVPDQFLRLSLLEGTCKRRGNHSSSTDALRPQPSTILNLSVANSIATDQGSVSRPRMRLPAPENRASDSLESGFPEACLRVPPNRDRDGNNHKVRPAATRLQSRAPNQGAVRHAKLPHATSSANRSRRRSISSIRTIVASACTPCSRRRAKARDRVSGFIPNCPAISPLL